jgi:UDP-N-acetylmuramoylalanine--D-glutamate ligase
MNYSGKQIAVLGAGRSGETAAVLLAQQGAQVTVLDSADTEAVRAKIVGLNNPAIQLLAGPAADSDAARYELGVLSPGIDPVTPLVKNFLAKEIPLIGELELGFELCKCPIVAITGTNGKTTTTELVALMFQECGVRTVAAGNIGTAFTGVVSASQELDVVTLEVSSFQLETIHAFHPKIVAWLNLTPDHLDRYNSMEEYRDAKLRIFENQTAADFVVVNSRDDLPPLKAQKITFSAYQPGADFELRGDTIFFRNNPVLNMKDTHLRGLHNAENLMAALGMGLAWGLDFAQMRAPLSSYRPLPHRCELIRSIGGVDYVNDSKATNLDSLEKALDSESRPVVLIAGGKDKGFEFESLTDLVARKAHDVVLIGEMADSIQKSWGAKVACQKAGSLSEAVNLARSKARAGDVVLFSPGTSSFDMFKSYADRGNQFRNLIMGWADSV